MTKTVSSEPKADIVFEVSWEVCNKVGGIYTVIKSKAYHMQEHYKQYFAVGPYNNKQNGIEFSARPVPQEMKQSFEELATEGILCFYGEWNIKGKPTVLLIDAAQFMKNANNVKAYLWDKFKVDSLRAGGDYDEPLIWSWAAGKVIEKLVKINNGKKIVTQVHEWLSGAALLYLKDKKVPCGTVFTTHATILGRTIAGAQQPLYELLGKMNPLEQAKKYSIESKHTLEAATAKASDVFTTVSSITGLEAEHLLGRKPDVLVPNGLDFTRFPDLEQIPALHKKYKAKIKEFLMPFFFPYTPFDIENALLFFISGRYEFENKGIDIYIESLGKLNGILKREKSQQTIVAFLFIPAPCTMSSLPVIESKGLFEDIQDEVDDYLPRLREQIIHTIAQRKIPGENPLFDEEFIDAMRQHIVSFTRTGNPPLTSHEVCNPNDRIVAALREQNLLNRTEDRVKVVFYPTYVNQSDGLLDLDYYSMIAGMHLGVFPSYYEPWGYTPLECAAYGVSSITTDLAGFGLFVQEKQKSKKNMGISVVKRRGKPKHEVVDQTTEIMYEFSRQQKSQRIANKLTAEHFARMLDWKNLSTNYILAHNLSLRHG